MTWWRGVLLGGVFLLVLTGAAGGQVGSESTPSAEDTLVIRVDTGVTETVTRYFPVDETEDPRARARRVAAAAEVPVYGVSVSTVEDRVIVRVNGRVVDGEQAYYRTDIETELGERRGPFEREITGETLTALRPSDSAQVLVVGLRGTTVESARAFDSTLRDRAYEISETGDGAGITYRLSRGSMRALAVLFGASILVPLVVVGGRAQLIARQDSPVEERVASIGRTMKVGSGVFPVVALGIACWFGCLTAASMLVDSVVPAAFRGPWIGVSVWLLAILPFGGIPWLASLLAAHPAVTRIRGTDVSLPSVLIPRLERLLVTAGALWVGAVLFVTLWDSILSNPAFGGFLAGILLVVWEAIEPYLIRVLNDVDPVGDDLNEEIKALSEEAGVSIASAYRIDTGDERLANAVLTGVPHDYNVFLTDDLLERLHPPVRRAIVAYTLATAARHYLLKRVAFTMAYWFVSIGIGSVLFGGWLWVPFAFALYYSLALPLLDQELVYGADAYAAELTSPEAVVGALERIATVNSQPRTGGTYNLFSRVPPLGGRIRRLEHTFGPGLDTEDPESSVGSSDSESTGGPDDGEAESGADHTGSATEPTDGDSSVEATDDSSSADWSDAGPSTVRDGDGTSTDPDS